MFRWLQHVPQFSTIKCWFYFISNMCISHFTVLILHEVQQNGCRSLYDPSTALSVWYNSETDFLFRISSDWAQNRCVKHRSVMVSFIPICSFHSFSLRLSALSILLPSFSSLTQYFICSSILYLSIIRDSVVALARLRAERSGFWIPPAARYISLLHNIQAGFGTYPASCLIVTRVLSCK